ncbi:MAG: Rrf2 family transcriptional regulator [Desulfovibrio sp.]|jgi:Rrf2 family protein|nr:Rrf2 family transcriptional regulator [Desulfovibrio sp.]
MELSARSRYAVKILLELALCGVESRMSASVLSRHLGVSTQFAEQILKPLKKNGLINSARGAAGGYSLARGPKAISLGDVVRVMEDGINFTVCYGERVNDCPQVEQCPSLCAWEQIGRDLETALDSVTLNMLLRDKRSCPAGMRDASAPEAEMLSPLHAEGNVSKSD